jgi:hypothetical protein
MIFPGKMGEGIKREAARNIEKKTIKIGMPFIFCSLIGDMFPKRHLAS